MSGLKSQLEYFHLVPRKYFNFLGGYATKFDKYNFIKTVIGFLCPIYCVYTCSYSAFISWPDMTAVTMNVCATIAAIWCLCRFLHFTVFREQLLKLVTIVEEEFWSKNETSPQEEKNIMLNFGRFCYIATIFQMISIVVAGQFWLIEPILQMKGILPTIGNKSGLILPFEVWLPSNIDIHTHPAFDILYALQTFCTSYCIVILTTSDTLFFFIVVNLCAQFRVIQYRLKHFTKVETCEKNQYTYLMNCVQFHQDLYQFCDELENATTVIIFVQIFIISAFLCCSGLIITLYPGQTYNLFRNAIFMITAIWELFIHCFAAELLTTECLQVGYAAYSSDWFDSSNRVKKLIMIIIMRSQKPFHLTACKFTPASLESFQMVLRTAVSYFTVFSSIKDDV